MFCRYQREGRKQPKGTYYCIAHLAGGRALDCPCVESKIYLACHRDKDGKRYYRFEIGEQVPEGSLGEGGCRDFKIMPEVRSDLIKNLGSIKTLRLN